MLPTGRSVKISAVIITFNEEKNIGQCIDSVIDLADEIIVVDSFSTDETENICLGRGVSFICNSFSGHVEQKNYAMAKAKYDHILSLDADEVLSNELKESIGRVKSNWQYDAYSLNRLTNYCGKWIRHCGWYPDKKVRLWDRQRGCWGGTNPHDRVVMAGRTEVSHLAGDLFHYSYSSIKDHVAQMNSFSEIAAKEAFNKGRKVNLLIDILLNPPLTFLKKYFIKLGIIDGYYGFVISIHTAYGKFLKYIKLMDIYKDKAEIKTNPEN